MEVTEPLLVLNVDDNPVTRYARTKILQEAGFRTLEAATGETALILAASEQPQLILLDIGLPDINGIEVCRRLRRNPATASVPVVHISATHITDQSGGDSLEAGGDIFLAEPVEPQELVTVVRTLGRLRHTESGLAESEERMRLATEGAGIGTWDTDLAAGETVWNKRMYELLGIDTRQPASFDAYRARVEPADLAMVNEALNKAQRDGERFSHEHRILLAGGDTRWIALHGRTLLDGRSRPVRFSGIALDVTAQKTLEQDQERLLRLEQVARERAEVAARLQDEFLAVLSHELRTPLNAVVGWLQLLRNGVIGADQQAEALAVIERNVWAQADLINDLLDVSRIIAGKLQIEPVATTLEDVMKGAIESIRPAMEKKNLSLSLSASPSGPILADAKRLQQVFGNLLSNAVKFTPEGGCITVRTEKMGGFVRATVTDTGEGVEKEMLPRLFERFLQADRSRTRSHGGLGLGLAIARHLAEAHGGRIWAESPGVGQGTTMTVMLPIKPPAAEESTAATAFIEDGEKIDLAGLRVLVAEDDPSSRGALEQSLAQLGMFVRSASNLPGALEICNDWIPDLMLLDIGMPGGDGYQLIGKLHDIGIDPARVPAIAVTGYGRPEDRDQALAAGFAAHIVKPFRFDELLHLISNVARKVEKR